MRTGPCPACAGTLASTDGELTWVCGSCRAVVARPAALKVAAENELPFARREAAGSPPPGVQLPRGRCPLCRDELVMMSEEPWAMCPGCRVRVVPRLALGQIAQRPSLADRTPLGIPSDDIAKETPQSRVFRMAFIAFLLLCAAILFKLPATGMEECQQVIHDPSSTPRERRIACEQWVYRDILAAILVAGAGGLGLTLRSRPARARAA